MNHIRQCSLLETQLKDYKEYLPICPDEALPKLVEEILKIHNRIIAKIKLLKYSELLQEVHCHFEEIESKLNYIQDEK